MAKSKRKLAPATAAVAVPNRPPETAGDPEPEIIAPKRVCDLLGLPEPYESPPAPSPRPGYVSFWDPGRSILDLKRKHAALFCKSDWYDSSAFAKQNDVYKWRQIRVEPIKLGEAFAAQFEAMAKGNEIPAAREVVTLLLLHVLATKERRPDHRLRCRDTLPSGRRVLVGPFTDFGLELANCGDDYVSPGIALAAGFPPPPPRKR